MPLSHSCFPFGIIGLKGPGKTLFFTPEPFGSSNWKHIRPN